MNKLISSLVITITLIGCSANQKDTISESFINTYTNEFTELYYASAKAEWAANTHIVKGDTTNAYHVQTTGEAMAKFTGNPEIIKKTKELLQNKETLSKTQIRQLEAILYSAANNPQTISEVVNKRIAAENNQNETLFGYDFNINNTTISTAEIDSVLRNSKNLESRLAFWEASKDVGIELKDGLENLRNLRNETVQALGYKDYFSYQVSEYGMTRGEMMIEMKRMVQQIWPLYRELHTWARYNLAEQYKTEVPQYLPAHWLPNRWGQDWSAMVNVEGLSIDNALKNKSKEWMVKEGENFYVSIGFDPLPNSFYEKSSMYPLAKNSLYKKNNHASAWHMNLDNDVRCLMSVENTAEYFETIHHELGHIYYYQSYTNPEVPALLRSGANRGFHEAFGSLLGLAAMQKPFLEAKGLIEKDIEIDETQNLLKDALNYIVFIPFSAGVMSEFEHSLYAENLPKNQYNRKWWELAKKYQGITPPSERGEEFCDAASKTHINNDAAQYYDYAISYILLFQFHDHIAKHILKEDPHATNYYGNKEIGKFLHNIMKQGADCDWNEILKESLGSEMSATPMLNYFEPLMKYLEKENIGRIHTLPEHI